MAHMLIHASVYGLIFQYIYMLSLVPRLLLMCNYKGRV